MNKRILTAILLSFAAFTIWSCGDAGTKFAGKNEATPLQIMAGSALSALFTILLATLPRKQGWKRLIPHRLSIEIPRAICFLIQAPVNIITFTQLPLTTVYAALFLSPILISLAGALFLKENLGKKQGLYMIFGFIGSLIAINPFSATFEGGTAMGWMLLPAYPFLFSLNIVLIGALRKTESPESLALFPIFLRVIVCVPLACFFWHPLSLKAMLAICGMGVSMGVGTLLMTQALARAPGSIVSPLHYTQLVTGALLGYFIWNDIPRLHTIAGSLLIILSGLAGARLVTRREKNERPA